MKTTIIYKISALIVILIAFQSCRLIFTEAEMEEYEKYRQSFLGGSIENNPFNWNYIFPQRTLGVSAGAGFENEFDQTTLCLGVEYNYRLTAEYSKPNAWYIGGYANYSNTSFNDNKWNSYSIGVKPHIQIPITPLREGQLTLGANLAYDFGNQEANSFNEDFSGFRYGVYGGINMRLSEKFSLGFEFPIFSALDYTYKPEVGDDVSISETSLLVNKNNPAMLYARFTLGGNSNSQRN